MKKMILVPILSLLLIGVGNASAQDKSDSKKDCHYCCYHDHGWGWWWRDYEFCHSDFNCYRAWKKDQKRQKKECLAREMECYRPFAAERKRHKAMKKAWKRDVLAAQHETWGWGHDYWY